VRFWESPDSFVTDLSAQLVDWLAQGLAAVAPERAGIPVVVERPKQAAHGDYATNVALQHAKALKRNPRELAQALVAALPSSELVAKAEIAGAGFINLFLTPAARTAVVTRILEERERYGRSSARAGERVIVEFVSANPTGPLHVGHGRQAALGDAVATLLEWQGAALTREFYYNDAGQQIQNLAISVRARAQEILGEHTAFPEDGYHGEYIRELAQRYLDEVGHDLGDIESIRRFAVAELRKEQDRDLQAFGVRFDNYYLESSLYTSGRVDATVERIRASGQTFEQDGALWLRTSAFGDDKDRVMRKSDGGFTYFVPDVAYHVTKWERGFLRAINVQGSDHHSTMTRVRAGLQAIPKGQYEGAMAVGLGYWQMMYLIVLPQALKITIPNIVNTYIGLFKDTTLVVVVGIFDFLRTVEVSRIDPKWAAPTTSATGYVFAAIFYFIFCYGMSRYAKGVEARLGKADRR